MRRCPSSRGAAQVSYGVFFIHYLGFPPTWPGVYLGVVVGEGGGVARTSSSGASWLVTRGCTNYTLYDVSFDIFSEQGFMVGEGGAVCWTQDRGVLWRSALEVQGINNNTFFRVSQWANDSYALLAGSEGARAASETRTARP